MRLLDGRRAECVRWDRKNKEVIMKKFQNYPKIIWLSAGIFGAMSLLFWILSTLMQDGVIPVVEFSQTVQSILAFLFFFPLLCVLFFTGQYLKTKSGMAQTVYKVLTFVSVTVFIVAWIQILLSIIGVYD